LGKQRLIEMVIRAIDEDDLDWRMFECFGGG